MTPEIYNILHPEDSNFAFLVYLKQTLINFENSLYTNIPQTEYGNDYDWAKAIAKHYVDSILETIEENTGEIE